MNQRFVKIFSLLVKDAGTLINDWIRDTGAVVCDMRLREGSVILLYEPGKASKESDDQLGPPIPLTKGARAPTVNVVRRFNDGNRPAQAMAGVFGVPEGAKLHTDDAETAPLPLLSPDWDIKAYADLFGNVEAK